MRFNCWNCGKKVERILCGQCFKMEKDVYTEPKKQLKLGDEKNVGQRKVA